MRFAACAASPSNLESAGIRFEEKYAVPAARRTGAKLLGGFEIYMPPILGRRGVDPLMGFPCCDCGDVTTGEEMIAGAHVHVVKRDARDLANSVWRCECCQEDLEDREQNKTENNNPLAEGLEARRLRPFCVLTQTKTET